MADRHQERVNREFTLRGPKIREIFENETVASIIAAYDLCHDFLEVLRTIGQIKIKYLNEGEPRVFVLDSSKSDFYAYIKVKRFDGAAGISNYCQWTDFYNIVTGLDSYRYYWKFIDWSVVCTQLYNMIIAEVKKRKGKTR